MKETVKRYIVFLTGLFFMGIGIGFTKTGELGVSPISSVANVISYKFTFLSMGTWLTIWNFIMIIAQILILRKKFRPLQLLQIPIAFLLGYFTDFGVWCGGFVPTDTYIMRLVMVIAGVVILGFGIALSVIADVIMNAGEALVKTIADTLGKSFGNTKIVFDVSSVALSVVLSLIFFDFTVVGTREGTVIAALGTGIVVKWCTKLLKEPVNRCVTSI